MAKTSSVALTRPPPRSGNKLLAALPEAEYRRLSPSLTPVPLTFKKILHKQSSKIDTVYFPESGVCSVTNVMTDGRMVEVATVGNEGMVGVTIFLGGDIAVGEAFVQVPGGNGQSMPADAFKRELDRRGSFYDLISRYSQALQALIMQSTACNSLHTVEERASRWLLMTHDRVAGDEFQLTHEFLGYMLGVRRPTVSLVLGTLDKAGVIHNGMKKITIVNRERLEHTSCECYQVVRSTFARLFPPPDVAQESNRVVTYRTSSIRTAIYARSLPVSLMTNRETDDAQRSHVLRDGKVPCGISNHGLSTTC